MLLLLLVRVRRSFWIISCLGHSETGMNVKTLYIKGKDRVFSPQSTKVTRDNIPRRRVRRRSNIYYTKRGQKINIQIDSEICGKGQLNACLKAAIIESIARPGMERCATLERAGSGLLSFRVSSRDITWSSEPSSRSSDLSKRGIFERNVTKC